MRAPKEIAVLAALVVLVAAALPIHAQVVINRAPLPISTKTSVLEPVHQDLLQSVEFALLVNRLVKLVMALLQSAFHVTDHWGGVFY